MPTWKLWTSKDSWTVIWTLKSCQERSLRTINAQECSRTCSSSAQSIQTKIRQLHRNTSDLSLTSSSWRPVQWAWRVSEFTNHGPWEDNELPIFSLPESYPGMYLSSLKSFQLQATSIRPVTFLRRKEYGRSEPLRLLKSFHNFWNPASSCSLGDFIPGFRLTFIWLPTWS